MIAFRVRGRVVSVLCGGLDPALADIQLNVMLDQDRSLDPGEVVSVEAGQERRRWRVSEAADDGRSIEASIIIPVFNSVAFTIACAISVFEHASSTRYEIIVADDASSDETADVFATVGGVLRCVTHRVNGGFIRNCN